jgi:hypothetical protein
MGTNETQIILRCNESYDRNLIKIRKPCSKPEVLPSSHNDKLNFSKCHNLNGGIIGDCSIMLDDGYLFQHEGWKEMSDVLSFKCSLGGFSKTKKVNVLKSCLIPEISPAKNKAAISFQDCGVINHEKNTFAGSCKVKANTSYSIVDSNTNSVTIVCGENGVSSVGTLKVHISKLECKGPVILNGLYDSGCEHGLVKDSCSYKCREHFLAPNGKREDSLKWEFHPETQKSSLDVFPFCSRDLKLIIILVCSLVGGVLLILILATIFLWIKKIWCFRNNSKQKSITKIELFEVIVN